MRIVTTCDLIIKQSQEEGRKIQEREFQRGKGGRGIQLVQVGGKGVGFLDDFPPMQCDGGRSENEVE